MKIAITGANGFVGSSLIHNLKSQGLTAIALVRRPFAVPGVETRIVDYASSESLRDALSDVDILIHNAGKTKTLGFEEMLDVNVGLTRRIVSVINSLPQKLRLIYISSQAASGPSTAEHPKKESDPMQPITYYGKSKALAEKLIHRQCTQAYNIIRPCSVYGPGDRDFLQLFELCQKGISVRLGLRERPLNMIHVSQLSDFILRVAQNPRVAGETFFATDTGIYLQEEVVAHISRAMGKKALEIRLPMGLAGVVCGLAEAFATLRGQASVVSRQKFLEISASGWVADCSKARKLLDWQPEPELESHIRNTYQWYISNGWL